MDHISIPSFALLRYGTVIVRLKMEKSLGRFWDSCLQANVRPKSGVVHRVSGCEGCARTRIVSQYSDCDSELLEKCRPYRTRAAKSRNVNVCAAVCLLLLVGVLTPGSSAAPPRTRNMEQEDDYWSNPCGYDLSDSVSKTYEPSLAEAVVHRASTVLVEAEALKQKIADLHSYATYEALVDDWRETEWLRSFPWATNDVLPKGVEYGKEVHTTRLKSLTSAQVDEILPLIAKAMKMVGRSLIAVSDSLSMTDRSEGQLKPDLKDLSNGSRYLLCHTFDLLKARRLEMPPVYDTEVPVFTRNSATKNVFLVYRDTLNFLTYIKAFFAETALASS